MRMFLRAVLWDWRMLVRSRIGVAATLLGFVFVVLAAWNGSQFAGQWRAQSDAALTQASDARERLLADIASGLRDRLRASPLTDVAGLTRALENAYRARWAGTT